MQERRGKLTRRALRVGLVQGRMARNAPVGEVPPDIAGHVIEAEAIGREGRHRGGAVLAVIGDRATYRLRVVRRPRKCLHDYLHLIDPEFGWMHVRVQTWAPYQIQVSVNGRKWLARQLDALGIGYRRSGNKIKAVDDLARIEDLCRQFARAAAGSHIAAVAAGRARSGGRRNPPRPPHRCDLADERALNPGLVTSSATPATSMQLSIRAERLGAISPSARPIVDSQRLRSWFQWSWS
jgi:hypothetical protein